MIYKITADFSDTEAAQSAARRISGSTEDVYEIKMTYLTRHGETGSFNNVFYTTPATSILSREHYSTTNFPMNYTEELPTDNSRTSAFDYGETCTLTVLTSENSMEDVRRIIYNSNGYSMNVEETDDVT